MVNDQTVAPTATAELAHVLLRLIETKAFGLYHVTNSGECTWFELACETLRLAGLSTTVTPVTSAEYNARAKRPTYSILDNGKLRAAGVAPLGPWQAALAAYLHAREVT